MKMNNQLKKYKKDNESEIDDVNTFLIDITLT